jgi:hypothetical protein
MSESELARYLGASEEQLRVWEETFPPDPDNSDQWSFGSEEELKVWRQRAALLRTNMSARAVRNVEEAGLLQAYADLAEDCPEGITAHVWRSYGIVVLMQTRYGKTIGPAELARRANLQRLGKDGKQEPDEDMARKHLRLLIARGLLDEGSGDWSGRWEHQGLPKCFQG